ncbi:DUF4124 domain-containing protein [Oleiphilus messinensis]|nr:DUF4124 domain-containing protein [Oleiphilus messinensis]
MMECRINQVVVASVVRWIICCVACTFLMLCSINASAKIYKCVVNGKTVYSDEVCGDGAQEMDIKITPAPSKPAQAPSTQEIEKLTEDMARDRQVRELDRAIVAQERKIERLKNDFNDTIQRLEQELADVRSDLDRAWRDKSAKYTRQDLRDKKRDIQNQISDIRRRHYTEVGKAQDELYQLRKKRRRLPQ